MPDKFKIVVIIIDSYNVIPDFAITLVFHENGTVNKLARQWTIKG